MTEEEKKEFEEFLRWKKEKAEKEGRSMTNNLSSDNEVKEKPDSQSDIENKDDSSDSSPVSDNNEFKFLPIIIAVIAIIVLFTVLGTCSHRSQPAVAEDELFEEDSIVEVEEVLPEPSTKLWNFTIKQDEMTDTKNIWASIQSDDYISQAFPYEGNTYASITVRYMKKYGYDVIIQITKGQINGREYYGTDYVTARFDEGSPKKYYFNEAADGSSETIFLRNSSDFISRCKKAKDIIIDIPVYKYGRPVFTFHVDEPLVWRNE